MRTGNDTLVNYADLRVGSDVRGVSRILVGCAIDDARTQRDALAFLAEHDPESRWES
jgi:hypothetical protein